jgi:hypothetical protein
LGEATPVGPPQHLPKSSSHQDGILTIRPLGRVRCRRCLLKGCERLFRPGHPLARYCSRACQAAARRWSCWQATRRYRQSEEGRRYRREQSRRYRERAKARTAAEAQPREGHHKESESKKSCCARPGCYELFELTERSPAQRFCGPLCRQALRRVLVREARWRRIGVRPARPEPPIRCRGP